MKQLGVDISEHNGSVDFSALQNAGVQFVILRCGFGSDCTNQDDARFEENVQKAEAAGMPWGAYLYSYATNSSMAQSEAQHALRLLQGKKPLYGVWYDVEDPQIAGGDLTATCQTFCGALEAAGVYTGIYASLSWLNGLLNSPQLDRYDKWVAQWNSQCTYAKPYGIWQYTDSLSIGGKAFDGNYAYKDYPSLIAAMDGENGTGKEYDEMPTYQQWKDYMEQYLAELATKPVADWAQGAVAYAKESGLMNGDTDGNFRPQSPITRQELAAVLANLGNQ